MNWSRTLRDVGVVIAATIGAGIFALPYIFARSGFLICVSYVVVLGGIIISAHILYWRVLDSAKGERGLVGLARKHLGPFGYILGIVAVVVGLILALVIYLILGGQFLRIFLPSFDETAGLLLFWFLAVLPLFFKEKKIAVLEDVGSFAIAAIIVFIFLNKGSSGFPASTELNFNTLFLPFGALLFALAGWTAIEPLHASYYKNEKRMAPYSKLALPLGTIIAAALYLIFVSGILAGGSAVTPDTISGFLGSSGAEKFVLAVLGIFAVWNSYKPISLEVKNALERDLRWGSWPGLAFVVFVPLILVLLGLNSFSKVIGLSGGLFLSLEYILILLVARRALKLSRIENLATSLAVLIFIIGAIYEVYYFVVG